jgi:hypothetical protein
LVTHKLADSVMVSCSRDGARATARGLVAAGGRARADRRGVRRAARPHRSGWRASGDHRSGGQGAKVEGGQWGKPPSRQGRRRGGGGRWRWEPGTGAAEQVQPSSEQDASGRAASRCAWARDRTRSPGRGWRRRRGGWCGGTARIIPT